LADCFTDAEEFAFPVEAEGDFEIFEEFTAAFGVENHIVEFAGEGQTFSKGMGTFVGEGAADCCYFDAAAADAMAFEREVSALFVPLEIELFGRFWLANVVVLIEAGGEIEVSCEMCEPMA
jgi:hypothetical protein